MLVRSCLRSTSLFICLSITLGLTCPGFAQDASALADSRTTLIANAETWRQFDLLMRSETFGLDSEEPVGDKGASRTIFTRLAVDFDKEQCFCFMSGVGQDSDERFDRVGICHNGNTGYREFPGGASNLKSGIHQLLNRMYVPDLRCLALRAYPTSFYVNSGIGAFEEQQQMGPRASADISKFKVRTAIEKNCIELILEGKISGTLHRIDAKTNMPLGHKVFRVTTSPWTLSSQEDYQWEERDGVFLPVEIGRDFPVDQTVIDYKLVIRKKSEIVQIHWLSFNQLLDPKLFELSTVNDISKLRKLIDPEVCGAERLR